MDSNQQARVSARRNRRFVVAHADELSPGQRKIVTVSGREIGIFNVDGEFYALRNVCPHRGAPLCKGRLSPLITSAGLYQVEYQREGEILKCPWHLWEFDVKTGCSMHDPDVRVRAYRVAQEGDDIVLYLD